MIVFYCVSEATICSWCRAKGDDENCCKDDHAKVHPTNRNPDVTFATKRNPDVTLATKKNPDVTFPLCHPDVTFPQGHHRHQKELATKNVT